MKILLSHKLEGIGGGARFFENFCYGMTKYYPDVTLTHDKDCTDYDILFIITPTSIKNFDFIDKAKELGKKIIVRFDNMPKNSRNKRYRAFQKMIKLAKMSTQVIYQSDWAKEHIAWGEIPNKGTVIPNGVNEEIFNKDDEGTDFTDGNVYREIFLILTSSSDPCKRLHESLHIVEQEHKKSYIRGLKPIKVVIGGRLPTEYHVRKYRANWDFVRGEEWEFIGDLKGAKEVAKVMRGCTTLLFPSFCDAAPNTVLEAKACGLNVIGSYTGGTPQMLSLPDHKRGLNYMITNYYQAFQQALNTKW